MGSPTRWCRDFEIRSNFVKEWWLLGIIDSLSAGYRLLSRRLELLLIPILLDLFLWMAPRLSIAPLFERVARFYTDTATLAELPSEMGLMAQQVAELLSEIGHSSNLLSLLVRLSGSLLHLPSLLSVVSVPTMGRTYEMVNISTIFVLGGGLTLLGLMIGTLYLLLLARQLPIGTANKTWQWGELPKLTILYSLRVLVFVLLLGLLTLALLVPISLGMALVALVAPGAVPFVAVLFSTLVPILWLYLYFVPIGLIVDDLRLPSGIVQSFRLVRDNFWATLGLLLLSMLISAGFSLILSSLVGYQPFGPVIAILVNAFIGGGLALGLMVFYRSRILLAQGEQLEV